jgi:histidyl-tRNA synthetase
LASGIAELETVTRLVEAVGVPEATVRIDLSIARGLGYYTGIIYETRLTACPGIGSVCSGGRYDNLTQTFMRERCPGVGASIGLDRLMAALEQLGLLPTTSTSARVLIAVPSPELSERALTVGAQLRNSGIPTEVYPDAHKMKRQVEYAKRAGHPYLLTFQREGVGMVLERVADGVRTECAEIASVVKALS